jgi:chromosome segregation ATPase
METKEWKSPMRKLVPFFERSRNRWKEKYRVLKHKCKLLANQIRAVEASRQCWREKAEQAEEELRRLQQELEQHKKSFAL